MGAGQSVPSQNQLPSRAFHVLRVTPSSPASKTTIEPFFDFVVGFEGDALSSRVDAAELEKIVESHEGRTLNLVVWSSKDLESRVVSIIPSREWTQTNVTPQDNHAEEIKPSLLGLSMRMCEPEVSLDNVWHVLDVLEGSPAESAGLVPYGDWIIGWSGGVLSAEGDFYDVVEAHMEKPLRVYVYSYDFDTIREVVLVPNRQWGGEGLLGCVFGFGLLHRIPPPPANREPGAIPPELFESEDDLEEQKLFVPADFSQQIESEQHNGWHKDFRSGGLHHEEEDLFNSASGQSDRAEHDYYEQRVSETPLSNASFYRPGSSNRPRVMTPTPTRVDSNGSGTLTNGIDPSGIRSLAHDQTTNARHRSFYDDDLDEAISATDSNIAESREGVTSDDEDDSGSLTSVD